MSKLKAYKVNLLGFIALTTLLLSGCFTNAGQPPAAAHFIVLGDWGNYGRDGQQRVAAAMKNLVSDRPLDFIVTTGDNIYDVGVSSADDPLWQTAFEDIYSDGLPGRVDWYVTLGNHDYQGSVQAQIDYGEKNPHWKLPRRYHELDLSSRGVDAQLLFLDTNPYIGTYQRRPHKYKGIDTQAPAQQTAWLENRLQYAPRRWKLLFGHHPLYSGGRHGDSDDMQNALQSIMSNRRVSAYFAGHDHHLQHEKPAGITHHFISGAGSKTRSVEAGENTRYAASTLGFAYVTLTNRQLKVEFWSADAQLLYTTEVRPPTVSD